MSKPMRDYIPFVLYKSFTFQGRKREIQDEKYGAEREKSKL
jgi:hypothetical protein